MAVVDVDTVALLHRIQLEHFIVNYTRSARATQPVSCSCIRENTVLFPRKSCTLTVNISDFIEGVVSRLVGKPL